MMYISLQRNAVNGMQTSLWSRATLHAATCPRCEEYLYTVSAVTSYVTSIEFRVSLTSLIISSMWPESLMYERVLRASGFINLSTNRDMLSVGPLIAEIIGLPGLLGLSLAEYKIPGYAGT